MSQRDLPHLSPGGPHGLSLGLTSIPQPCHGHIPYLCHCQVTEPLPCACSQSGLEVWVPTQEEHVSLTAASSPTSPQFPAARWASCDSAPPHPAYGEQVCTRSACVQPGRPLPATPGSAAQGPGLAAGRGHRMLHPLWIGARYRPPGSVPSEAKSRSPSWGSAGLSSPLLNPALRVGKPSASPHGPQWPGTRAPAPFSSPVLGFVLPAPGPTDSTLLLLLPPTPGGATLFLGSPQPSPPPPTSAGSRGRLWVCPAVRVPGCGM